MVSIRITSSFWETILNRKKNRFSFFAGAKKKYNFNFVWIKNRKSFRTNRTTRATEIENCQFHPTTIASKTLALICKHERMLNIYHRRECNWFEWWFVADADVCCRCLFTACWLSSPIGERNTLMRLNGERQTDETSKKPLQCRTQFRSKIEWLALEHCRDFLHIFVLTPTSARVRDKHAPRNEKRALNETPKREKTLWFFSPHWFFGLQIDDRICFLPIQLIYFYRRIIK